VILYSLIFVAFVLALAGMAFPVVAGVDAFKTSGLLNGLTEDQKAKVNAFGGDKGKLINKFRKENKAGVREVDDVERERRLRLYKQCSLMANLEKINKRSNLSMRNYMAVDSNEPYDVIRRLHLPRDKDGETVGPEVLFELTSDEISSLVPKVRIFKVVYPEGSEGDPEKAINIELPFDDHTDPKNILNITKQARGKSGGVGLKSFEWTSLGTNPANVNIFEANMTLFFQSIEELFTNRGHYPEGVKISDNERKNGIRFADLLVQQAKFRKDDAGEDKYNPDYFRLKAVVGWAEPTGKYWETPNRRKIKKLLSRINTNMSLTLQSHELDFRENGSLEVKIKYTSAIEGIMDSPGSNILTHKDPNAVKARIKHEKRLKELKKRYLDDHDIGYDKDTTKADDNTGDDKKALIEKIEKLEEDIKNEKIIEKNFKYSGFISELLARNQINTLLVPRESLDDVSRYTLNSDKAKDKKGNIKKSAYDAAKKRTSELNSNCTVAVLGVAQTKEETESTYDPGGLRESQLIDATKEGITFSEVVDLSTTAKFWGGVISRAATGIAEYVVGPSSVGDPDAKALSEDSVEATKEITEALQDSEADIVKVGGPHGCTDEYYQVKYFKLGTLIDIALENIFLPENLTEGSFKKKNVKIILGSFTYSDYGEEPDGQRGENLSEVRDSPSGSPIIVREFSGKEKVMNIADIPVSLDSFSRWFQQKVISPGKERYLFSNFVRDLLTDLIPMSLGQNCYEYAPKQKVRFTMLPITVNSPPGGFFKDVDKNRINASDLPKTESYNDQQNTEDILYIYAETESPYRLTGDYEEDKKKGIPHFYWGADTGIVKSLSFTREDQPFLRESNITRGMDEGATGVGKILREKYNAAISLFGNNLYYPGQKVYVTPSVQTLGKSKNVESRIRELGFGGYYDVIKVSSVIEPGVFETKLETKWQCFGDGKYNDGQPVDKSKLWRASRYRIT